MFEELIMQLDEMGVNYQEDMEAGSLAIDVAAMDKMQLIEVLNLIDGMGMTVSLLDETSLVIEGGTPTEVAPVEEDAMQDAALDEAMMGM